MRNSYKELIVWQRAMELTKEIYRIVRLLPREERYVLSEQMRRAAVSVPSNIAEGQSRNSKKDFINFLSIAKGSNAELETQCILCVELGYVQQEQIDKALHLTQEIGRMLTALKKALSSDQLL